MPAQTDVEHLLRRTEYVARPARVSELMAYATIEEAVDDVLDAPTSPGSVTFTKPSDWERSEELTHFWLDRMAHDSPRPIQEKMAFFWHGHFCSSYSKVGSAALMREQIDLFRRSGLGNVRALARTMSTQVAMLRYLDNNLNLRDSPNQNFARELKELFLLGVGNYTEADVEAATAAWTGHTDQWDTGEYVWRADWHDDRPKQFLGQTINVGGDPTQHGYETIDVILGAGVVPAGATVVPNRGRPTRAVAAEFLSKKLWLEFAGTDPSASIIATLRDALLAGDFAVRPWLRALLTNPEFYSAAVRTGRVRTPVEYMVAMLVATGLRSTQNTPLWLMEGMGQRPLFPPNVSGWRHNGYWVNASAVSQRTAAAQQIAWRTMTGYWEGDHLIHLAGGSISQSQVSSVYTGAQLVDRILELMRHTPSTTTYNSLVEYSTTSPWWDRTELVLLSLLSPDLHVA